MSSKRGRKCSLKECANYQRTHKHLSFFRFPKDVERCKVWIEKTRRFDLLTKTNVHDERICQQHFEADMFLNESQNRLQPHAIPTLFLATGPPQTMSLTTIDDLRFDGFSCDSPFDFKTRKEVDFSLDMTNIAATAAFLYQNNLTITPVYSPELKPMQLTSSQKRPIPDLLNLTSSKQNDRPPPNGGLKAIEKLPSNDSQNKTGLKQCEADQVKNIKPSDGNFRRPRQIFTMQQEFELADYVRDTSNYYSGLSSKEVRILAFVYGICNRVDMPTGWHESHQASFDWIVGFMKRTKLPTTMITGISIKGSTTKQSKLSTSKANKTAPTECNRTVINNDTVMNNEPIEID